MVDLRSEQAERVVGAAPRHHSAVATATAFGDAPWVGFQRGRPSGMTVSVNGSRNVKESDGELGIASDGGIGIASGDRNGPHGGGIVSASGVETAIANGGGNGSVSESANTTASGCSFDHEPDDGSESGVSPHAQVCTFGVLSRQRLRGDAPREPDP